MVPDPSGSHQSFPYLKYPAYRDEPLKLPEQWMKGKRLQDGAEGLWRVHDGLYDLTDFVPNHPGGEQWLTCTKGTDITEAFETHHLKGIAEVYLNKHYARKAQTPRNSPFTFKEHDFYKTLKAKVTEEMKHLPKDLRKKSDTITDILLLTFVILSPLCCWVMNKNIYFGGLLLVLTTFILSGVVTCAHNYFHRADNWRMYLFNLSGFCYSDWRISHAMSHHLFTNTLMDIELTSLEPFLKFMPYSDKDAVTARLSCLYWPIIYMTATLMTLLKNAIVGVLKLEGRSWSLLKGASFYVLIWMYVIGGASFLLTVCVWSLLQLVSSFVFIFFGLTAGHHADTNFFDGDIPREEHIDWGIHQLDAVTERSDYRGNLLKIITMFGAHSLHHLFPTLDHAELEYFLPIVIKHAEKYEVPTRSFTLNEAFRAKIRQLVRNYPNDIKSIRLKNT